jgi:translation elongation factor aEF-1 beta
MSVQNAVSLDHRGKEFMGEVIGLIRVMPGEVISDEKLHKMIEDIKSVIKPPAKVGRINIKDVAFGLKGLDVTVLVPDDAGGLDPIVEIISKVENVDSAEVTDVGRV